VSLEIDQFNPEQLVDTMLVDQILATDFIAKLYGRHPSRKAG
jgi:hypothetical protein